MRALVLKTMVSLDGFLEGPDGAMDWFPQDDAAEWQQEFKVMADVDTVLLGRGMYPGYSEYWRRVLANPSEHSKNEVAYARWADKTRHIVFSRSLRERTGRTPRSCVTRRATCRGSRAKRARS